MNASNNICIIGLGNPDDKYKHTWHNIGKLALKYIINKLKLTPIRTTKAYQLFKYNNNYYFILPNEIFMNQTGQILCSKLYHCDKALILYDDIDLQFGSIKISPKSNKQHKGVSSIINCCRFKKIIWIKIGIRTELYEQYFKGRLKDYVLKAISLPEMQKLEKYIFPKVTKYISHFLKNSDLIDKGY